MNLKDRVDIEIEKVSSMLNEANETTGVSDTTLYDAIHTLIDGYGRGGGDEYNLYAGENAPTSADDGDLWVEETGGGSEPDLITKTIYANGTYDAEDDNADGYSSITVAIPTYDGTVV